MRTLVRRLRWGAPLLVCALILAACGDGGSEAAVADPENVEAVGGQQVANELDQLYQAAQDAGEDSLVIYGSRVVQLRPLFDAFEERFPGITVEGVEAFGPELQTRLDQEFASGQHVGDFSWTGNRTTFFNAEKGRFASYRPSTTEGLDDLFIGPNDTYTVPYFNAYGIGYNTNLVSEQEAPRSWRDLLDPRWRGKICLGDPTHAGGEVNVFTYMLSDENRDYSVEYIRRLAAQQPTIVDAPLIAQQLATGQCALGMVYSTADYAEARRTGAPVGLVFPVEGGNNGAYGYLAMIDGAPHPNAARLFATWMHTPGVAAWLADAGLYPTAPGSPSPEGLPPLEEVDLFTNIPDRDLIAEFDATIEHTREIF